MQIVPSGEHSTCRYFIEDRKKMLVIPVCLLTWRYDQPSVVQCTHVYNTFLWSQMCLRHCSSTVITFISVFLVFCDKTVIVIVSHMLYNVHSIIYSLVFGQTDMRKQWRHRGWRRIMATLFATHPVVISDTLFQNEKTDKRLYTDTRYDKIRYNDNLNLSKPSVKR